MFADEPTGNLDSTTSGEILELMRELVDGFGQTTVMVTHDPHAAAIADRVLFLADGEIVRDLTACDAHTVIDDDGGAAGGMRRVALKGLWLRRGRAMLTACAVVLGVAMVSGTFVLTDTINKAFDSIFQDSYSKTSAVISGREVVKDAASGNATVPASLLDRVRADGQRRRGHRGDLQPQRHLRPDQADRQATASGWARARTGSSASASTPGAERFNPLSLTAGRWASGPGEVVIDKGTARATTATTSATGSAWPPAAPCGQYTITGIARYGTVNSIGGATIAVFDVPTAQALLGKRGQYDTIFVAARDGVSSEQLVARPAADRPGRRAGQDGRSSRPTPTPRTPRSTSKFIQYFLLGFGFIALGVGAFVIFNTLSITLAQRIRELATLRTLGASRRQVRRSVLTEGLAMGVFASVVGLVLGLALAKGLNVLFEAFGVDLPERLDGGRDAHDHRGARRWASW